MYSFEELREQLRNMLPQLHDPRCQPPSELCQLLRCDPAHGPAAVQSIVIAAISDLEPGAGVPADSWASRAYQSLQYRFVVGLSQWDTADRLHMSVRNLQRVQAEALHALARRLWQEHHEHGELTGSRAGGPGLASELGTETDDWDSSWESQATLEVASLQETAPGATADIDEAVTGVLPLVRVLAQRYEVAVTRGYLHPGLVAAVHPAPLRQTLLGAIIRLLPYVCGELTVSGSLQGGTVKVMVSGPMSENACFDDREIMAQVLTPADATVDVQRNQGSVFLSVRLPLPAAHSVLVVEDNLEMVEFYRRCTAGTTFRILHAQSSADVLDLVRKTQPNAIVLDVMLPDADGWELLTRLHENPETRRFPVIVCSVVRERELALSLGAACYLAKPVRPSQFVSALCDVVPDAQGAVSTD